MLTKFITLKPKRPKIYSCFIDDITFFKKIQKVKKDVIKQ